MEVSIIAIGDELLIGQVVDTNSGWIAQEITPYGWRVKSVRVVADNAKEIKKAVEDAFNETDIVLTTGGLGPTKDDITKQTLCDFFGGELIYDKEVEKNVLEVVAKRSLTINPLTAAQAYVPSSCRVIQNKVGTAPIMWFEKDGKVLVSMPGVPFEMQEMMHTEVFPQLKKKFQKDETVEHRTFIVIGYSESLLAAALENFESSLPQEIHLAYLPKPGLVRLRLTGVSKDGDDLASKMEQAELLLKQTLAKSIICDKDMSVSEILGDLLSRKQLTVSTAESCTGGNIAHEITTVAGCSSYFKGTVVAYANEVKQEILGVSQQTLEKDGAVSEPTVRQMAEGVAQRLHTDCCIATSGIAGPGGGTEDKPVGTVWIAATANGKTVSELHRFAGNRSRVINHATTIAQLMLIKMLLK